MEKATDEGVEEDAYFKKLVSLEYQGQVLRFRVAQALFSSFQVDLGTRLLLRSLADAGSEAFREILDLGCGYGPIGLALKKADERRVVHLVDRDALAVEYSRQNAALNQLSGVEVYGSLGYDDVPARDFDLIVSNIPGKAGERAIAHFLLDAMHWLKPDGLVAIVLVASLEPAVTGIFGQAPNVEVVFRKAGSGHVVLHYHFVDSGAAPAMPESAMERGVFDRMQTTVDFQGVRYLLRSAYNLPEFDSPGFRSTLLMEALQELCGSQFRRALVFNPGQGHVPVVLWRLLRPGRVRLVDRDLLSLRYSEANLILNECPGDAVTLSHQVGVGAKGGEQADLIAGVLREEEGPEGIWLTVAQAAEQLAPDGTILVAGSSTAATRLVKRLNAQKLLRVAERKRRRGNGLLVLRH
ncbi:MAG: hypothetical protein A2148_03865 [Chloroflexi bacterium RBG_16_68_14]|nr:MAG: hypothetical protein A2148_03865 [Chloroflexi bacterium RBG_16_68_14]